MNHINLTLVRLTPVATRTADSHITGKKHAGGDSHERGSTRCPGA
jgi:hypothetical protein